MAAFSLLELIFVLGLAATLTGIAIPQITHSICLLYTSPSPRDS